MDQTTEQQFFTTITYTNRLASFIKTQAYCTSEELSYAQAAQYINNHEIAIYFGNHAPKIISLAKENNAFNIIWKKENIKKYALGFSTGTIMLNSRQIFEPKNLTYSSNTQSNLHDNNIMRVPNEAITHCIFSPNGKHLAACSLDNTLRIFNVEIIQEDIKPYITHTFTKKPIQKIFLNDEHFFIFSKSHIFIYELNPNSKFSYKSNTPSKLSPIKKIYIQQKKEIAPIHQTIKKPIIQNCSEIKSTQPIIKTSKSSSKLIQTIFNVTKYTTTPKHIHSLKFVKTSKKKQPPKLYEFALLNQQKHSKPTINKNTDLLEQQKPSEQNNPQDPQNNTRPNTQTVEPIINNNTERDTTNYLYNSLRNIFLLFCFVKCVNHLGKMKMDPHAFLSLSWIIANTIIDGTKAYFGIKNNA